MLIVLPFAEKFVVEEASGDMLFPRSLATTGTCTYLTCIAYLPLMICKKSLKKPKG
jgi:hypothetical protein